MTNNRTRALLVNVSRTWPQVLAGTLAAEASVLGDWGQLPDDAALDDIEVVIGVCDDVLVRTFVLDQENAWKRVQEGRVRFSSHDDQTFARLEGMANPGWLFSRRGAARSSQFVPLSQLVGQVAPTSVAPGVDRAVVGGYVLELTDGTAFLTLPAGGSVTVRGA